MNPLPGLGIRRLRRSLHAPISVVLGGLACALVVYRGLRAVSSPVTFGLGLNVTTAVTYAIALSATAGAYRRTRENISTYIVAAEILSAAYYYDVRYHTAGTLSAPINLALQKSLTTAFVCWMVAVGTVVVLERLSHRLIYSSH